MRKGVSCRLLVLPCHLQLGNVSERDCTTREGNVKACVAPGEKCVGIFSISTGGASHKRNTPTYVGVFQPVEMAGIEPACKEGSIKNLRRLESSEGLSHGT